VGLNQALSGLIHELVPCVLAFFGFASGGVGGRLGRDALPLRPPGSLSIVGQTHEPALFLFDGVQARVIVPCPTGRRRCPTVRPSS
jgi:hypothetical protein